MPKSIPREEIVSRSGIWCAGLVGGFTLAVSTLAAAQDPCERPANAIVAEICQPGNPSTEWDIGTSGDPSIQGFATDISVNRGEAVQFKIQTDSPDYRIDIYRMGYYGGMGARRVTTIEPSATLPQSQPACLTDPETRLFDCGNWNVSASWDVPADAVSGIYFARLVRDNHTTVYPADTEGLHKLACYLM